MRLLISETDPLVQRWLDHGAEELGVQLEFATSSTELLRAIDGNPPDCVVLDAASSHDAVRPMWRELREAPAARHIPILLYSSSSRWQSVAEQIGSTVDGYIPRPFSPALVVEAAQRAAARRQVRVGEA